MNKNTRNSSSIKADEKNKRNVEMYLSGNKSVITNLYNDNYNFVKNILAAKLYGKTDVSEDLAQDVMIKMINNLDTFKNTETMFRSWLICIARTVFLDYVRKQKIFFLFEPLETDSGEGEDNSGDDMENVIYNSALSEYGSIENTFSALIKKERKEILNNAIDELENCTHKRVINKLLEGKSYKEISDETGENLGTIKAIIFRTKKELSENTRLLEIVAY